MSTAELPPIVIALPNDITVVNTAAGAILVNSPPETLKYLIARGLTTPQIILLPPDLPTGRELGSSGFVRQGINYASVEFLLYSNFFGPSKARTHIITTTAAQAERIHIILDETINGPNPLEAYGPFPWLQHECISVGYYPPLGREPRVDDLASIASLEQGGGQLENGTLIQLVGDEFVFSENGTEIARVSTHITEAPAPLTMAPPRPLLRQEITLQFIGGSDGFDPQGITTCFLAYFGSSSQTHATLFDAAAYLRMRLGNLGMSTRQISEVVLSHLHEDHLAGLPELLLMGDHRVRLLTSDIVYEGLLRVLSAMLAVPSAEVATLFDYYPLNPGKPLNLDGRFYEAIYAVHSIPTIAVRVNSLCYSGDMRYDEHWFAELQQQGVISAERYTELVGFAENSSILVQDAGGGAIHTTLTTALLHSLASKSRKIVLAHTSRHMLPAGATNLLGHIEFAESGHVMASGEVVVSEENAELIERVETLTACPLFARLTVGERMAFAERAVLANWQNGDTIVQEGQISDGEMYIIHSGLVEIHVKGKLLQVIGRGNSVGERGALQGEKRISTLVARGQVQLLAFSAEVFRPVAEQLGLNAAFKRADWLWARPAFKQLPWATVLDLALDFQPREFEAGEFILRHGEPGYECYLLVSGGVSILDRNGERLASFAQAGEFFGGRAALFGTLRNASVQAAQKSELWALPAPALQRLQMVYPNVMLLLRSVESARHGDTSAPGTSPLTA